MTMAMTMRGVDIGEEGGDGEGEGFVVLGGVYCVGRLLLEVDAMWETILVGRGVF